MRNTSLLVTALALTAAVSTGCATKKLVRTEIAGVNEKVVSLTTAVEATEQRTSRNEARIGTVDAKADAATRSAADAQTTANAATGAAKDVDTRLTARVVAVETAAQAERKLIYAVTLSEGEGNFKSNGSELPAEVKARLDAMVHMVMLDSKTAFIEVEGHTDNQGQALYNEHLGLERAETVKRYLYEQHQVPLHKINVISYGAAKPVASNATRAGRAQNRRIVVRILS